ncbi:MAG TPA: glucose-1-phosphate cytidylyltransferase, partial [Patescibacteria group bacterium]|nr:glucose-1-phosphate cytidylyltransferase [Patescibacteria group bacterium]
EPDVFNYLSEEDTCVFEREPMIKMAADGKLAAYKYGGFWQCMDTQRDKGLLEELWARNAAPWKRW